MDVVVNAAMSADGKLSTRRREQLRISGPADFARVDRLRAASDGIMVGIGTVLADDPALGLDEPVRTAARQQRGQSPVPARIVADSRARTPPDARILDGQGETYLLIAETAPAERRAALRDAGAQLIVAGEQQVALPQAFNQLEAAGIDRLLVEGGGKLIFSLFDAGLVDELSVYIGNMIVGGETAPTLVDGPGFVETSEFPELSLADTTRLDDGIVLTWTVADSS